MTLHTGKTLGRKTGYRLEPQDRRQASPSPISLTGEGFVWNARWGGSCVVRHAPDGSIDRIVELPVSQVTCPAFGGSDLKRLFITTANKNLPAEQLAQEQAAGGVFFIDVDVAGQPETPIAL